MAVNHTRSQRRGSRGAGGRRAFTLIEILFSIALIFVLIGLLIAGLRLALSGSGKSLDRAALNNLKMGVEQFKQQTGFLPPLVQDQKGPLDAMQTRPLVYDEADPKVVEFLCGRGPAKSAMDPLARFSDYSLPYYVLGVLDIDGVQGPGFRTPARDGTFAAGGRIFEPFFDVSRNPKALAIEDAKFGKVRLRDRKGTSFRYYRWLRGNALDQVKTLADLNVPAILGDPAEKPELKDAEYALVSAGPNGVFGDELDLPPGHPDQMTTPDEMAAKLGVSVGMDPAKMKRIAAEDNIVEVGR